MKPTENEEFRMSSITVTAVGSPCILGEGPFWDAETQVLYYVDILGQEVRRYNHKTRKETFIKIDAGQPTFVLPIKGEKNKLLISMTRKLAVVTWDGESPAPDSVQVVGSVEEDRPRNRFNDGKADPSGTLWAGTMGVEISPGVFPKDAGAFYSFMDLKSPMKHFGNVGVGIEWVGVDERYEDNVLHRYRDVQANRRTVIDFKVKAPDVRPDGMTIDADGKLWVANVIGSKIIRVDPSSGTIMQEVAVPSRRVTSVTFGGPDLDELYVTTTKVNVSQEDLKKWPQSGSTFLVTGLGVKGYAGDRVVLSY
ncbi:regucalcin-like [Bacillus rossius redtenbacheri]|uniref:regucalcin-like n=1 Tax=Bacillus rossius redtenbacheri TaxID=93214 RepID=UPI002FDEAD8E